MSMNIVDRIRELGRQLKGRLDPDLVDYALEYIDHSEILLAFEMLCDQISDYDVLITSAEYSQIESLVRDLEVKVTSRYLYINPEKK